MPRAVFAQLNEAREEEGKPLFANPRNAAAGSLRQLDPAVAAERRLDILVFNLQLAEGREFTSHIETLEFLQALRFHVIPHTRCATADEALRRIAGIGETRDGFAFDIDGAVVKVRDMATRQAMGYTDKFPRWAIAYKFAAEENTSTLLDVTWELGRTGKLTPVAHLTPVDIGGVTVQNATLNNYDDILRKKVAVGCDVWIRRSNDVIPEIMGRVGEPGPDERPIEPPAVSRWNAGARTCSV